jgi:putative oxidoreductase
VPAGRPCLLDTAGPTGTDPRVRAGRRLYRHPRRLAIPRQQHDRFVLCGSLANPFLMKPLVKTFLFGASPAATLSEAGLLVLRVLSGLFLAVGHGWPKLQNPSGFIDNAVRPFFPLPEIMGWGAILGELIGGLLLALGLLTRPAAAVLIGVFAGAAFINHGDSFTNGNFFLPNPGSAEPAVMYLMICFVFLLAGSGRTGVDRFLR